MKITLCALSALGLILLPRASAAAPAPAPEMFPTDSRNWSRQSEAMLITDLSQVTPAEAVIKGTRKKGKWKTVPYATADFKGWALSAYGPTAPPLVRVPLSARGWHAVYLGISTVSNGFNAQKNGLKAKLGSERVFRHTANNLALLANRRDVIQEQFLSVAYLDGDSVEMIPLPGEPVTVCYIKLVPLTAEEAKQWPAQHAPENSRTRTAIGTFDGHSWIWPYQPKNAEDLLANFRGFEDSDIGKWWFQVVGADLVCYPSKVGTIPGEDTEDFNNGANASYTTALRRLFKMGINPLRVAREAARAQHAEFHVMLRLGGWQAAIPLEEEFHSKFYVAHPEWRCVDRDGTPTMYMSYAVPEVRRHLVDVLKETLDLQPEGVGFLCNRGMPTMLWEPAFSDRFKKQYNTDAHDVPEDDPRIYALRGAFMTEFVTEIRAMLDETAKAQGRKERYKISLGTFSKEEDNQKWGMDLPLWIQRGLVDDLGVAWFSHHTSFAQPDMAYYKRITQGSKVGVYPFVIAWKPGTPKELCKTVTDFYAAGATGIAIWDPQTENGWPGTPHGNIFDTLALLGHRDLIAQWKTQGVPLPLSIPLTQLDENFYSRFFPNTGF